MTSLMDTAEKIGNIVAEKLLANAPEHYLLSAKDKFADILPYESTIVDEAGRDVILMNDGALGTMWEMTPIAHEILDEKELDYKLKQLGKILEKLISQRLTLQVYFLKETSTDFPMPSWIDHPDTFARKAVKNRIEKIRELTTKEPELQKISVFICLRLDPKEQISSSNPSNLDGFIESSVKSVQDDVTHLQEFALTLENGFLSRLGENLERKKTSDLVYLLRKILHGNSNKQDSYFQKESFTSEQERISDHILKGPLTWEADAIGVGDDTLEVMSWQTQPHRIFPGLMSSLLQIKGELYAVMNIRPKNYTSDLESKSEQAKGSDPLQRRQKIQLDEVHDRITGGEKILHSSLQVIYRNQGLSIDSPKKYRKGKQITKDISDLIPLFVEEHSSYLAFVACLPFMYSKKIAPLLARERRIMSADIGYLLPVLGGMTGSTKPKQLMQSRVGEAIWLNNRQSPTNPHFCIYGESGSGKSFFAANHLIAEHAYDSDLITILIDSLTSYEFLARAIGEDHGFEIIKPPEKFPNIFYGEMTPERLPIVTSVLKVAVSLISKGELSAPEETLLGDSLTRVYKNNLDSATRQYVRSDTLENLGGYEESESSLRLPKLSDIVAVFSLVAAEKALSKELVKGLTEKLLPFFGSGPYAKIFDQEATREIEEKAPGFILYDLADIGDDQNLCTITTIILIAETERLLKHPLNKGRSGNLIFEEAQTTLNSGNTLLSNYIKSAYARFRKLGWACGCIGNMIDAFSTLSGPKAAWELSATKIILPLSNESEQAKLPDILKDPYHCELAKSLQKIPGKYSQYLYLGNPVKGTGVYVSTGHDYWLSANEGGDRDAIEFTISRLDSNKPYQAAINVLAETASTGYRDEFGALRPVSGNEKSEIILKLKELNIFKQEVDHVH